MYKSHAIYLTEILLALFIIADVNTAFAAKKTTAISTGTEDIIKAPAKRLPENERIIYKVRWLGLPAGEIIASIDGVEKVQGRDAYKIELIARTNDFCSMIYKIEDRYLSYMDVENLCTLRHEVYRREGRYKKDAVTDFDQKNHKAYFKNLLDGTKKEVDIPERIQDTLTACYYFRVLPLKVGDRVEYAVYNNEKTYELFGLIKSKGFIRIPKLGKKETFYVQPYAKLDGEDVRKGRVSGYFSCDGERIPLLAVVRAPMFTEVTASPESIEIRKISK